MSDQTAQLCHLLTSAHFAGVPTTRLLWSHVSYALDAAQEELPPEDIITRILQACIEHPLSSAAPRDPKHSFCMLQWLCNAWESRGWTLPDAVTSHKELQEPQNCPELCYKTYIGWGGGLSMKGVTLLESCGGIVHHTTGLTTWGGAAVLADWVTNNPDVIACRRVLELGAGVGFTASVVLTSLTEGQSPPTSYIATDCHHHVLTLLHHNLELNLREEPMKREDLEKFQEATEKILVTDEAQTGEMLPWTQVKKELNFSAKNSSISEDKEALDNLTREGTKVEVLQVDWREPPVLPDVDVVIAADVVYAHHLIPHLVTLIKGILDGSACKTNSEKKSDNRKSQRSKSSAKKGSVEEKVTEKNLKNTKCEKSEKNVDIKNKPSKPCTNSETNSENEHLADLNESNLKQDSKTNKNIDKPPSLKTPVERVAYIACTRRTLETINLFLEEVTKQGLRHSLVYQATLDTDTFLFVYNETHLPVKIFKLVPAHENSSGED